MPIGVWSTSRRAGSFFHPFDPVRVAPGGRLPGLRVKRFGEVAEEHFARQRGFARPRDAPVKAVRRPNGISTLSKARLCMRTFPEHELRCVGLDRVPAFTRVGEGLGQGAAGDGVGVRRDLLHRPHRAEFASATPALDRCRSRSRRDGSSPVVLDDEKRVPEPGELAHGVEKHRVVARVKTDRRFVEDVAGPRSAVPNWLAKRMRCASPPESVGALRSSVR